MTDAENGIARGDVLAYLLAKDETQPQDEPLIAANSIPPNTHIPSCSFFRPASTACWYSALSTYSLRMVNEWYILIA